MKKKYYTPCLEEFSIGFEYEKKTVVIDICDIPNKHTDDAIKEIYEKNNPDNIPYTELWIKGKWNGYGLNNLRKLLKKGYIRVKYLDNEGIESLGFNKLLKKNIPERFYPLLKDIEKVASFFKLSSSKTDITWYLQRWHSEYNITSITIIRSEWFDAGDYDNTIFDGDIKNISELKIILKQLGITI